MPTTILSSKGQIVIPKTIRDSHHWQAGTRFVIEENSAGLFLKPEQLFSPTRLEDGLGCLNYNGPARTIEEMNQGIDAELRRRCNNRQEP